MRIKSVKASVFGRDYEIEPEHPVVVITGGNGAGKSTMLHLPELAVRAGGRTPFIHVGKDPADFDVTLTLDRGGLDATVRREVRKGKHALGINGVPKNVDVGQGVIDATLGEAFAWSMPQLMGMTPQKRLRWLQDHVLDAADDDFGERLKPFLERLEAVGATMPAGCLTGQVDTETLLELLDKVKEARLEADREAKRLTPLVRQDEEERGAAGADDSIEEVQEKLAELSTAIEEKQRERGEAAGAREAVESLQERIREREEAIKGGEGTDPEKVGAEWEPKQEGARQATDDADKAHQAAKDVTEAALEVYQAAQQAEEEAAVRLDDAKDSERDLHARADVAVIEAEQARDRAARATEELQQLREDLAGIDPDVDIDALDTELTRIRTERQEVQATEQALLRSTADDAVREERRAQHVAAVDRRAVALDMLNALGPNGLLGESLSGAFGGLVGRVNEMVEPVLGVALWVETEGGFAWGFVRDGERIPIHTASESEQMAAVAAFVVAVRAELGGWRFIAVDGLEVMERERRTAFVEQMILACEADLLDGFWCASVEDGWTPPKGAQHVRLDG